MKKNLKDTPTVIQIGTDNQDKKSDGLYAHVVDSTGTIIESAVIKNNTAQLNSSRDSLEGQSKIYISQPIPGALAAKANESTLVKAGAYQVTKSFDQNKILVTRIPANIYLPWIIGNCLIQGNITNTVTIDGKPVTVPVCGARVHLVEVETELIYYRPPYYIRRIPDWVINEIGINIRNISLNLKPPPRRIPIPDPIGPVEKLNLPLRSLGANARLGTSAQSFSAVKSESLPVLADHIVQGLNSGSIDIARQTLIAHYKLLYPYICLWPHLWYWIYVWDEDNITYTDCNGHFEYWENTITEDGPLNIYTWVEVLIHGVWTTVYKPYGIPCFTWWNYPCNSPININLYNPNIPICECNPLSAGMVWIKRVGSTSLRSIMLEATESGKTSLFADGRGLTNSTGIEGAKYVSPFTSGFSYVVQFGDPVGAFTHFRWKYRRITDGFLNPIFLPAFKYMDGPLSKPYTYITLDGGGNKIFNTGYFTLDVPVGTGKIYKIPHTDADVDTGDPTAEWRTQDTDTIYIGSNTDALSDGIYEFMFELCNSAGVVQTVADNLFEIDFDSTELSSTPAIGVNADYVFPGSGSITDFRFLIRIDNNGTSAQIFNAAVLNQDGTTATTDTQCGFAKYQVPASGDLMEFFISAVQLHRYGTFSFGVVRGNSGGVFSAADQVAFPPALPTDPTFSYSASLSSLLGSCDKAAFAENLYVWAYHTNGSIRHSAFDSSGVAAFAVEPR